MKVELNTEQLEYIKAALLLARSSGESMLITGQLDSLPKEGIVGVKYSLRQWRSIQDYLDIHYPLIIDNNQNSTLRN